MSYVKKLAHVCAAVLLTASVGADALEYRIRSGDTLSQIAQTFAGAMNEPSWSRAMVLIVAANPQLQKPGAEHRLAAGTVLQIPLKDERLQTAVTSATQPVDASSSSAAEAIKKTLEASRTDIKVKSVAPSEIPGLYAVQFEDGPTVYASPDAKYFVLGDLYQVQATGYVNLAEERRNVDRAKQLAAVPLKDMIVFKSKAGTKGVINVFTDVECGWCQRFHQDVPRLNAMGIEVRYLAFPRAGIDSDDYRKMVTAWCAKDRQAMLTRYKNRESVKLALCDDNPVKAQYELGERLGVNGTPSLVTPKGELIPGYVPPEELARTLGIQ